MALLFVALTVVMTWPQVEYLGTRARQHQDVYFNMWRLRWFAHALATAPSHLFDGNIFHPERAHADLLRRDDRRGRWSRAPLLWAGVPPVLVHNLLLLRRDRRVGGRRCSCWRDP